MKSQHLQQNRWNSVGHYLVYYHTLQARFGKTSSMYSFSWVDARKMLGVAIEMWSVKIKLGSWGNREVGHQQMLCVRMKRLHWTPRLTTVLIRNHPASGLKRAPPPFKEDEDCWIFTMKAGGFPTCSVWEEQWDPHPHFSASGVYSSSHFWPTWETTWSQARSSIPLPFSSLVSISCFVS